MTVISNPNPYVPVAHVDLTIPTLVFALLLFAAVLCLAAERHPEHGYFDARRDRSIALGVAFGGLLLAIGYFAVGVA